MNKRIKELMAKAGFDPASIERMGVMPQAEKFATLLLKEVTDLMQERWYELNDEPKAEDETLRDIGLRLGKKSELVRMKQVINMYFGVSVVDKNILAGAEIHSDKGYREGTLKDAEAFASNRNYQIK